MTSFSYTPPERRYRTKRDAAKERLYTVIAYLTLGAMFAVFALAYITGYGL